MDAKTETLLELLAFVRTEVADAEARVRERKAEEKYAVSKLPLELFSLAHDSYSCKACREDRHADCQKATFTAQGGSAERYPCTCFETTKELHIRG